MEESRYASSTFLRVGLFVQEAFPHYLPSTRHRCQLWKSGGSQANTCRHGAYSCSEEDRGLKCLGEARKEITSVRSTVSSSPFVLDPLVLGTKN